MKTEFPAGCYEILQLSQSDYKSHINEGAQVSHKSHSS